VTARGYVICSYPRSGTNFLCQLLASTGTLGHPQDWFNGPGIRARDDADYPLEPEIQLRQVLARGVTPNGVYGMKMFCDGFDRIARIDWVGALPQLHWIHLERLDLLGQAISDVRANQTKQFRSTAPVKAEPRFDRLALREALARTVRDQARWKPFFARNAISPLSLTYEAVAADPQAAVDAVGRLVGLAGTCPIRGGSVTLAIQRDVVSEEWRARFLSTERDLVRLGGLPSPAALKVRRRLTDLWQRIGG
jgi:LPS sulfotransferase NodH